MVLNTRSGSDSPLSRGFRLLREKDIRRFLSRQNILVFFMVIAVLYGLYEMFPKHFSCKASVDGGKKISEIHELAQRMLTGSKESQTSAWDRYVLGRAEAEWGRDPFCDRTRYREWKLSQTKPKAAAASAPSTRPPLSYTGYLEDKGRKIAIINGTEYMAGESLELEGYTLKKISPSRVIIEERSSRKQFDVPFQE